MKTLLKFAAWGVAIVLLLAVGAGASAYVVSNARLTRKTAVTPATVVVPTDAAAVARGKHLAHSRGCAECHGGDFGGAKVIDDPAMGLIHGPNLTRGAGGLDASYQDADYVRAIRHGLARDGRPLFLMPSEEFAVLSDSDLGALVAYLKTIPPVDRSRVPLELGPVARTLVALGKIRLAADLIDHAHLKPVEVEPGETPEYGRYVGASCMGCHGANFSGGPIAAGPPDWPPAANLTPHAQGRVAKWTQDDFLVAMRSGKRPDGSEINPVMPRIFGQMNDTELRALWRYLETLPPVATGVR